MHFARNLLAHAGRQGRRVVSAFVATAFAQEDADSAKAQWRQVADQLRPKVPKLAVLMDEAEHDVLAYMTFPKEHRQKLHSTNPIERLHAEVKRRTNVVGIFPNEAAITRLVSCLHPLPAIVVLRHIGVASASGNVVLRHIGVAPAAVSEQIHLRCEWASPGLGEWGIRSDISTVLPR